MKTNSLVSGLCRWTARILSVLLILMFFVFAIGEGMPSPLRWSAIAWLGFFGMVLFMIGSAAGWKWERAGGIASLLGVCTLIEPTRINGRVTWFFAVLALPGVLYLVSHLLRHARNGPTKPLAR